MDDLRYPVGRFERPASADMFEIPVLADEDFK